MTFWRKTWILAVGRGASWGCLLLAGGRLSWGPILLVAGYCLVLPRFVWLNYRVGVGE